MPSKELSNYAQSNADEVWALVQVGGLGVSGTGSTIGGVTAAQTQYVQQQVAAQAEQRQQAAGNGTVNLPGGRPGPFDPRGAFQVPNNFWGFVILILGLKS